MNFFNNQSQFLFSLLSIIITITIIILFIFIPIVRSKQHLVQSGSCFSVEYKTRVLLSFHVSHWVMWMISLKWWGWTLKIFPLFFFSVNKKTIVSVFFLFFTSRPARRSTLIWWLEWSGHTRPPSDISSLSSLLYGIGWRSRCTMRYCPTGASELPSDYYTHRRLAGVWRYEPRRDESLCHEILNMRIIVPSLVSPGHYLICVASNLAS